MVRYNKKLGYRNFFYNGSVTGIRNLELLQNQIEEEISMLPSNVFQKLVWQQDEALAYSVFAVRE